MFVANLTRASEEEGATVFVLRWHSMLPKTLSEQLVPSVTAKAVWASHVGRRLWMRCRRSRRSRIG